MPAIRSSLTGLSIFYGQFGLTKSAKKIENKDTYYPSKMSRSEKLAPVLALGAMLSADPALAEDRGGTMQLASMTQAQVTDCVAFVKDQRALAAEHGIKMSRKDQKLMLLDC